MDSILASSTDGVLNIDRADAARNGETGERYGKRLLSSSSVFDLTTLQYPVLLRWNIF